MVFCWMSNEKIFLFLFRLRFNYRVSFEPNQQISLEEEKLMGYQTYQRALRVLFLARLASSPNEFENNDSQPR